MKKTKSCEVFDHDFQHLVRHGRADYRCPKCGENVMILLVCAVQAGIDLTKNPVKNVPGRSGR